MIKVILIKIVKKICKLADYNKKDSCKAQKENNIKLYRDSVFNRRLWTENQPEAQARLFDKFADIKTEEKRNRKITEINKEIAEAHHVPAESACVPAENVSKGIKKKHKACKQFYKNKSSAAVLLKPMTRPQKDSYLKTEE